MPNKKANPVGKPPIYDPEEHPRAARLLASEGKTHSDMAKIFDVDRHTIAKWRDKHPEFDAAIVLGVEDASDAVERCLWQRATGYSWKSEKILVVPQGRGEPSIVERVPITEHCPPDVNAIRFWLANRRSEKWKEKPEEKKPPGDGPAIMAIEVPREQEPKPPGEPLPPETPRPPVDPPAP